MKGRNKSWSTFAWSPAKGIVGTHKPSQVWTLKNLYSTSPQLQNDNSKHKKLVLGLYTCTQRICRKCEREMPASKWPLQELADMKLDPRIKVETGWPVSLVAYVRNVYKENAYLDHNETIQALIDEGFRFYKILSTISQRMDPWCKLFGAETDKQALNKIPIEKGAVTIASLSGRKVSMEKIDQQLDDIANLVRERLSAKDESTGEDNVRQKTLEAINEVMYKELGFKGATSEDHARLDNSFIDMVLERKIGIPITLGIVYIAVARRLGIHLEGLNTPQRFMIYYPGSSKATQQKKGEDMKYSQHRKEGEEEENEEEEEEEDDDDDLAKDALFIDPWQGKVMEPDECLKFISTLARRVIQPQHINKHFRMSVVEIYARVLRNIVGLFHNLQGGEGEETIWWSHHLSIVERWV